MTRYQKHMQHIHNIGAAMSIESAVYLVIDDVVDLLIKSGIKADSELIKNVRKCGAYKYDPKNLNKTK